MLTTVREVTGEEKEKIRKINIFIKIHKNNSCGIIWTREWVYILPKFIGTTAT